MRWRLRAQLLIPLSILLLGIVATTTWTAVSSANHARQQLANRVRRVAQTLSEAPQFPLSPQVLQHMKRLSGAELLLMRSTGQRVTTLNTETIPTLDLTTVAPWTEIQLERRITIDDQSYLYSATRLKPPKSSDVLFILYPESDWKTTLWMAIRPSIILGGFLGLASILLTLAVGQRLTRRVQDLERRARQIADGDFSPMPLPSPNDEIRDLSQSINDMTEKLRQLQETLQRTERARLLGQVSGGLAHQLRNGITGARLSLQLFMQDLDPDEAPPVEVALRQLTLLEAQLKRFFDLGQPREQNLEPCSIHELIQETITLLSARAKHSNIEIRYTNNQSRPQGGVDLNGDRGQLHELFLNLLTNAVEAAGAEGWAQIEVTNATADRLQIVVSDSGPGPPEEIGDKIFEPLVTGKSEGVGLGLAVARQIAEMHGGSLIWSREDGVTQFIVELARRLESGESS